MLKELIRELYKEGGLLLVLVAVSCPEGSTSLLVLILSHTTKLVLFL
jgi:hypothetical protein